MIRYLKMEETGRCRSLWQEAFPEDSQSFMDYYFDHKLKNSRILVKEDENGKMLTMAHLNPYDVAVGKKTWELSYIVGVATAADSRRKGHMRDVLEKMLSDMQSAHVPFCYLMPASESYYRPFGFENIFDQPCFVLREDTLKGLTKREIRLDEKPREIADWMNRWLMESYEVYAKRDEDYVAMLQRELDSENGRCFGWFDTDGRLEILQAVWGLKERQQRLLYCGEKYRKRELPVGEMPPGIMARITDVGTMLQALTVNEDCPCETMEVLLHIKDPLIKENDGLWRWTLDAAGSRAVRLDVPDAGALEEGAPEVLEAAQAPSGPHAAVLTSSEVLNLTVEQLTSWIFGYRTLDDITGGESPFWCAYIRCLKGVFLDEVV